MSTMIRPAAPARVHPGQLLGARQLADLVRRLAASPADWLGRGSAGAFAVVWGTLVERRVVGARTTGQVLAKPIGAGGARAFGPRYIHDVRNTAAASVAVSVHAYSPPLPAMTRYELTPGGLVQLDTEGATSW